MIYVDNPWLYFDIAFALMLLSTWLMERQAAFFYTKDPLKRKFSMLEMEFPATKLDLPFMIQGIYLLPDQAKKTVNAVRIQLLLDCFLFIPFTYGGIFVLCMQVAEKFYTSFGYWLFIGLAWSQCLCFLLDYLENIRFWILIGKPGLQPPKTNFSFSLIRILELMKWGLALVGFFGGFSALAYFWISGYYQAGSLCYVYVFLAEIIAFIALNKVVGKK
jgi:hypothetical protein